MLFPVFPLALNTASGSPGKGSLSHDMYSATDIYTQIFKLHVLVFYFTKYIGPNIRAVRFTTVVLHHGERRYCMYKRPLLGKSNNDSLWNVDE